MTGEIMHLCYTFFYPVYLSNNLQKHTILSYCKENNYLHHSSKRQITMAKAA